MIILTIIVTLEFMTLHGDLEQSQRETRLNRYRDPKSRAILVATDVAARGLDIDDIDVVIQCGCRHIDSFVHRSGRTGRVDKNGTNILFFQPDDFKFVLDLESQLNIKISIIQTLEEEVDQEEVEAKILGDFYKRAVHLKPTSLVNNGNHLMHNKLKEMFVSKQDENMNEADYAKLKEKMMNILILNYIDSHHQPAHQVGFLTGLKTYQTYMLKLQFDMKNKREYQKVRENLRALLEELKVENNFEFDVNGIKYLADLNHEKLRKVEDFIKRETENGGIQIDCKKVTDIGAEEKVILLRRFSRGGGRY